jgi:hypothetical protein
LSCALFWNSIRQAQKKFVLGGSAAAWSGDTSIFDYEVWEGAMSVAERLWSGTNGLTHPPPQPTPQDAAATGSMVTVDDPVQLQGRPSTFRPGLLRGTPPMPEWLKQVVPRLSVYGALSWLQQQANAHENAIQSLLASTLPA